MRADYLNYSFIVQSPETDGDGEACSGSAGDGEACSESVGDCEEDIEGGELSAFTRNSSAFQDAFIPRALRWPKTTLRANRTR